MNKFFVITCILFTSCMSEKEMKELRKELETYPLFNGCSRMLCWL